MSKQRLHPVSILFQLTKNIRHVFFYIVIGFISLKENYLHYFTITLAILFIGLLIYSILSWYRFTYEITDHELKIESGLFIRHHRYISKSRIQSIDLTSGIFHRIFKLVRVDIETAGSSSDAEASLRAVKLSMGEHIRKQLKRTIHSDTEMNKEVDGVKHPTYKISFKRLFLAGTTSGSIGVLLAIVAFGVSEFEQFIPDHFFDSTIEWIINLSITLIITIIILILTLLWIFGIAGTMIKYGNFTIIKKENELLITRGLLEKKQLTIPIGRIQAIGVRESILRQPLGYVTVFAELAGGSLEESEGSSPVLFPLMKADEVESFLQAMLPGYAALPEQLSPLPKRARKFYLIRAALLIVILGLGVGYFIPQFSWILIVLLVASLCLGILRHQDGGYHIDHKKLIVRYRHLSRVTMIIYQHRLQAFEKKQHKLQATQKLATMRLSITGMLGIGTHYQLKDLDVEDVDRLGDWYSHQD
ncbi:MAG TPA: PH domain-containing protein [Virgibacillus sp.]|nr:PH domain-containing protein [Virgibacillus sp.]